MQTETRNFLSDIGYEMEGQSLQVTLCLETMFASAYLPTKKGTSVCLPMPLPNEHAFSPAPEIPRLVDMIQAKHLISILNQINNDIVIFEILRLCI